MLALRKAMDDDPLAVPPATARPRFALVPPHAGPRGKVCTCGHQRAAHEHYRKGTDCALCDCTKYRAPSWFPRR